MINGGEVLSVFICSLLTRSTRKVFTCSKPYSILGKTWVCSSSNTNVDKLIYVYLHASASFYCAWAHTHTHNTHRHTGTHSLTRIQSLPGRPPWLTGLVNHLHNINGETFVTSNARLTQHLFNCLQETTARHEGCGQGSGSDF